MVARIVENIIYEPPFLFPILFRLEIEWSTKWCVTFFLTVCFIKNSCIILFRHIKLEMYCTVIRHARHSSNQIQAKIIQQKRYLYSKNVTPHVGLGQYSDRSDLLTRISAISYEGMGTNTGEALSYLHVDVNITCALGKPNLKPYPALREFKEKVFIRSCTTFNFTCEQRRSCIN